MFINRDDLCTTYTDLIGRFPCKSSSGNEYVLVAYYYYSKCIIAQALKKEGQKQLMRRSKQFITCIHKEK